MAFFAGIERLLRGNQPQGLGTRAFGVGTDAALRADRQVRAAGHRLGSLSARYETRGRGPGTINRGRNDRGGASYGSYQLATAEGMPQAFLRNEGRRWAREFGRTAPGTPAFDQAWTRVALREPEAFEAAQHAFIERERYRPAVRRVRDSSGLDIDARPNAIRDATWSMATQHGATPKLITHAVQAADKIQSDRSAPEYDELLLNRMYDERAAYLKTLGGNPGELGTYRNIVRNRIPSERADALELLRRGY